MIKNTLLYFLLILLLPLNNSAQSVDDFRTFQSGNWNSTSTWERFDGSSWINPAPIVPTYTNGAITIRNTHTVTVTASESADQTTVNAGGQITINTGVTLTIQDGTGTDLSVDGVIYQTGALFFNGASASGSFNSGSFLIHNNGGNNIPASSASVVYGTNSTIKVIAASASPAPRIPTSCYNVIWDCPTQSVTNQLIIGANTNINGDLRIINTNGNYIKFVTGADRTVNITGNLQIDGGIFYFGVGGTGKPTVNISGNINIAGGELHFYNGTSAAAPSALIAVSGNIDINSGTLKMNESTRPITCTLAGNLNITGGTVNISSNTGVTTFPVSGNIALSSGTLEAATSTGVPVVSLNGNWTKNGGTFTPGTGSNSISLTGSAGSQTIGGSTSTTFNRLAINNTYATAPQITLGNNISVDDQLTMTQGIINLSGYTLTLGTSAAAPGALSHGGTSANGWLYDGTFTRWFPTAAVTVPAVGGLFPMGSGPSETNDFCPFWLGSGSNLTSGGTASVNFDYVYNNTVAGFVDASFNREIQAVTNSSWNVSSTITPAANNLAIRFGGGTATFGTNNLDSIVAVLAASAVATWAASSSTSVTNEVNRTGLSLAELTQAWKIGTTNLISSNLPVTWLTFQPVYKGNNQIEVTWSTATEKNNKRFKVFRSNDGDNFIHVATVFPNSPNSILTRNYKITDEVKSKGFYYYRVCQYDINSDSSTTDIKGVMVYRNDETHIYPNPAQEEITITGLPAEEGKELAVRIINSEGKIVKQLATVSGETAIIINITELPSGSYFLINSDSHNKAVVKPFIKK